MENKIILKFTSLLLIGLVVVLSVIFLVKYNQDMPAPIVTDNSLSAFNSNQEIIDFFKTHQSTGYGPRYYGNILDRIVTMAAGAEKASSDSVGASQFSQTNNQVEGVDEADIVKNDGKYIYTISGDNVFIALAYPASEMTLLSEINLSGLNPQQMFINDNKLIVFGQESLELPLAINECLALRGAICPPSYSEQRTLILIYDISDRSKPELASNISVDGSYFDARMIGDYIYTISSKYPGYDYLVMPTMITNGVEKKVSPSDIYYPELNESSYQFTIITSLNLNNNDISEKILLTGFTQDIYVSENNIYTTYSSGNYYPTLLCEAGALCSGGEYQEITKIHKISVNNGQINFVANGQVLGHILNQFSMDEYNNYFRIATTISGYSNNKDTSTSNIYILNENLNITGSVQKIAPGESIYSVRFMGKRAYLVTFLHVDPLFVIDLSDVENPKILGKLKIPGYSDYLHPYDENHIIGIGKEVDASIDADKVHTEGAVYYTAIQGVKISLFDVTDVENPIEMDKVVIGDRGTESLATSDHKAFLFDKAKNLLVVPMTVAELKPGQIKSDQGEFTFSGAYVYKLTLEDGFEFKGRITHLENNDSLMKSGYYYSTSGSDIQRSLYMDNVLYTVSNKMIKANNLDTVEEINKVELPYVAPNYGYYPYMVF